MSDGARGTLPKYARLRKRRDFLRVQRDGSRRHTQHFVVLSAPTGRRQSRVGVTVSTRVGNAVVRNRVKRVLREVLREAWRRIAPPCDVVIIAKPDAARTSYANAFSQLRRALDLDDD